MEDEDNEITTDCYLYVYMEPSKVGAKCIKQIIPSSAIKKFDYNACKENTNVYKDKRFCIRLNPRGKKEKGYVLYAADSHHEVSEAIKIKRFRIPSSKFTVSVDENSSTDATSLRAEILEQMDSFEREEEERNNMLKASKVKNKKTSKTQKENVMENYERLLAKYINAEDDEDDGNTSFVTSTPYETLTVKVIKML